MTWRSSQVSANASQLRHDGSGAIRLISLRSSAAARFVDFLKTSLAGLLPSR